MRPNADSTNRATRSVMMAAPALVLMLAVVGAVGSSQAHAEMTIWQVETNPPGTDSGNEWLTLINTGEQDTFSDYGIRTTNGRIASYPIPTISLDTCEYSRIIFPRQAVDNEDDTVKLLKDGATIYETPTINDTKNDDRFWTNPDVAAACGDPRAGTMPEIVPEPPTETTLEERVERLESEVSLLQRLIQNILNMLGDLLNAS